MRIEKGFTTKMIEEINKAGLKLRFTCAGYVKIIDNTLYITDGLRIYTKHLIAPDGTYKILSDNNGIELLLSTDDIPFPDVVEFVSGIIREEEHFIRRTKNDKNALRSKVVAQLIRILPEDLIVNIDFFTGWVCEEIKSVAVENNYRGLLIIQFDDETRYYVAPMKLIY